MDKLCDSFNNLILGKGNKSDSRCVIRLTLIQSILRDETSKYFTKNNSYGVYEKFILPEITRVKVKIRKLTKIGKVTHLPHSVLDLFPLSKKVCSKRRKILSLTEGHKILNACVSNQRRPFVKFQAELIRNIAHFFENYIRLIGRNIMFLLDIKEVVDVPDALDFLEENGLTMTV